MEIFETGQKVQINYKKW